MLGLLGLSGPVLGALTAKPRTGVPTKIASIERLVRWAGLILATSLPLLLVPAQARAEDPLTISVGGVEYAIQFFQGSTFNDNSAVLQSTPWWGNFVLAGQFRDAYIASMTFPVLFDNSIGVSALMFAFETGESTFNVFDPTIGEYGEHVEITAPSVDYQSVIAFRSDASLVSGSGNLMQSEVDNVFNSYAYVVESVIDGLAPTVTSVTSGSANATYKIGQTISILVNFSESISVVGTPQLTLETGTTDRVINYASGTGTAALTFSYTVQAGDTSADLDYVSTSALALNSGTIKDAAGNNATLTLASPGAANSLGNNKALVIDGVAPSVTSVTVPSNGAYGTGQDLSFTVNWSEAAIVTGTPRLALTIGSSTQYADYVSGTGTAALVFKYTVQSGDGDSDGIAVGSLGLNSGTIKDGAGNDATVTLNSVASSTAVLVDAIAPSVTSVTVPSNGAYGTGQDLSFTVNWSEAATVTGTPRLALTIGSTTRYADYVSGTGTTALVFKYTVQSGDGDSDGIAVGSLGLNSGTIKDGAGNDATVTLNSVASSTAVLVDTVRPTASVVVVDAALLAGETSLVTFTFSEAVPGFANASLTIANGTLSPVSSADNGITWTATFTPSSSITDASNVITLDLTSVTDAASNAGSGTTDSNNYAIDTVRPTVAIVVSDTTLTVGQTSLVTFTFSEAVTGFENADVTSPNGTLSTVTSSGGGVIWTATFTPTVNVINAFINGIIVDLTGVANATGNAGEGTGSSAPYLVHTAAVSVAITVDDAALSIAETTNVTLTFNMGVIGFNILDLTAQNATITNLDSPNGPNRGRVWTLTLTPTVSTTDATNVLTVTLEGLKDFLEINGSGAQDSPNYTVDTVRPALASAITISDAILGIGQTATATFTFTEAVTGFTLDDVTEQNATLSNLTSGDGGITWTGTLTPDAIGTLALGKVITLDLSGIADLAGNAGSGTANSDSYDINSDRPTLGVLMADSDLSAGETSLVTFTFSEAVAGFTNEDITIANGTLTAVSSVDSGTVWTATFTPTIAVTDATNVMTVNMTGVTNAAGNSGSGTTDSDNYTISTVQPTVGIVVSDAALLAGETSLVTFTFSEAVTGFTNDDLTIANGTMPAVSSVDSGTV